MEEFLGCLFVVVGVLGILALWLGVVAGLACLLQFAWGWFAVQAGWQSMPFWVAFAIVFVLTAIFKGKS